MTERAAGRVALIGPGRAGLTITLALVEAGWTVVGVAGRAPDASSTRRAATRFGVTASSPAAAVRDADLVVIATPDATIAETATAIAGAVRPDALVLHLSGALDVDVLEPVPARRGALHPLQSLPSPELGLARLAGSAAAVAGDPEVAELARALGLEPFTIAPGDRAAYHAAACVASNHLVALLAQVEACTEVELDAFLPLVRATVENVAAVGVRAALTGPVARGDVATVGAHLAAIPERERPAYRALAARAAVLAGTEAELAAVLT
ncbi:MAG: Rossmann-like and DUF2520 domain-containing protein [Acidimicrobiia bacterium]